MVGRVLFRFGCDDLAIAPVPESFLSPKIHTEPGPEGAHQSDGIRKRKAVTYKLDFLEALNRLNYSTFQRPINTMGTIQQNILVLKQIREVICVVYESNYIAIFIPLTSQTNHCNTLSNPTPDAKPQKKTENPRGGKEKSSNQPHNLPRPLPPPNHSPRRHATPHWRQNPNPPLFSIHVRDVQETHDTRVADFSGRGVGRRVSDCEERVGEGCRGW